MVGQGRTSGEENRNTNVIKQNMSQAQRESADLLSAEIAAKAEQYEPMADWLMRGGQVIAYPEIDASLDDQEINHREDYEELGAYEKFELLANFYDERRDIQTKSDKYTPEDMIQTVAYMMEQPEAVRSGQEDKKDPRRGSLEETGREALESQEYPEVTTEVVTSHKTGSHPDEPELRKVDRILETEVEGEELKYTGTEEV